MCHSRLHVLSTLLDNIKLSRKEVDDLVDDIKEAASDIVE